jgi:hypothetical protein
MQCLSFPAPFIRACRVRRTEPDDGQLKNSSAFGFAGGCGFCRKPALALAAILSFAAAVRSFARTRAFAGIDSGALDGFRLFRSSRRDSRTSYDKSNSGDGDGRAGYDLGCHNNTPGSALDTPRVSSSRAHLESFRCDPRDCYSRTQNFLDGNPNFCFGLKTREAKFSGSENSLRRSPSRRIWNAGFQP